MGKQKQTSLLLPVFAARSNHKNEFGIGDVQSLVDQFPILNALGFNVLQLLPINETEPPLPSAQDGNRDSPYSAISAFALDPMHISLDPKWLPEAAGLEFPKAFEHNQASDINYTSVKIEKLKALKHAFSRFAPQPDYYAFINENREWLEKYSVYRVLVDEYKTADWQSWDQKHQSFATAKDNLKSPEDMNFYVYLQYTSAKQWKEVGKQAKKNGLTLMGDMPFGVSRTSCDAWGYENLVDLSLSIGVPPSHDYKPNDFVGRWGQNWGLPPFRTDDVGLDVYKKWLSQRVNKLSTVFTALRLDYISGNFTTFTFPWEPKDNDKYTYMDYEQVASHTGGRLPGFYPRRDNHEQSQKVIDNGRSLIKTIVDASNGIPLYAENIGYVADGVNGSHGALAQYNVGGCVLPLYEREWDGRFKQGDEMSGKNIAYYGNHDNKTLQQYWNELVAEWTGPNGDKGWREMQQVLTAMGWDPTIPPYTDYNDEVYKGLMTRLFRCSCDVISLPYNDLTLQPQINYPGVYTDANWVGRLPDSLAKLKDLPEHKQRFAATQALAQERTGLTFER